MTNEISTLTLVHDDQYATNKQQNMRKKHAIFLTSAFIVILLSTTFLILTKENLQTALDACGRFFPDDQVEVSRVGCFVFVFAFLLFRYSI